MAKDLHTWIEDVERLAPGEILRIEKEISPRFEVLALVKHFEDRGQGPAFLFENILNLKGERSEFPLFTNTYASRAKLGVTFGLSPDEVRRQPGLPTQIISDRSGRRIKPVVVSPSEAPCKERVLSEAEADLRIFPVMTQHELDMGPYMTMGVVGADPDTGNHNLSWHRLMIKDDKRAGMYIVRRHLWSYFQKAESRGEPLPVAYILGHHPAFYEAMSWSLTIEESEYDVAGALLDEPLRLVPSETWGSKLLVPADAEIVIEGVVLPGVREPEAPFAEWVGYYAPQRMNPVFEVRAITCRRDAIYMNRILGFPHLDNLGHYGMEAAALKKIREIVPDVTAVNIANYPMQSFIQMKKKHEGDAKRAAYALLGSILQVENVFIFDDDIDIFNPADVLFALASRVQPGKDVEILRGMRTSGLDPSIERLDLSDGMIIDATKPVDRPFVERLKVPQDVLERIRPEDYVRPSVSVR